MAHPYANLRFMTVGHSYVRGVYSGLGVAGNSYRREMYYRCRSKYGMAWTFVGSTTEGDLPTPYHDGVSGEDSDGLNTLIDGYLDASFATPGADDCIIVGPIGFADCLNSVALSTFNANLTSIISKIETHSPSCKIFLVTDPWCPYSGFPGGQDIDDYADEVRTVYATALAAGKNVYLIDINEPDTENINIGVDDIHPDWLGYEQMGELITDSICTSLGIVAGTAEIQIQDTFTGANGTQIDGRTPDTSADSKAWSDPNNRFQIQSNAAQGSGGYDQDTLIDTSYVVWEGQIKLYNSSNATTYYVFKSNSDGSQYLMMFLNTTTSLLYIYNNGGVWSSASFSSSLSTWYTFDIVIRGNSVEIFHEDVSILHAPLLSYGNYQYAGLSYYPGGVSAFDDMLIYKGLVDAIVAPEWVAGYPQENTVTQTAANFLLKTDIDSTAYFVCLAKRSDAPSSAQVKAGTDADGGSLAAGFYGSVSLTSGIEGNIDITGLSAATSYDVYFVAEGETIQTAPVKMRFMTDLSNASYVKRSLLLVTSTVELKLNLGASLDEAIDITKYVVNMSTISEMLSKSSQNTGGVILPSMTISLDNGRGIFNKNGSMFNKGFLNNSLIQITTNYVSSDEENITEQFIYKGLLKYSNCIWDREGFIFEASLIPPSNLLATEKVPAGILSASTTPTFADVIYKILNRTPYTKYLTIDSGNINLGWDVTQVDQYSDMAGTSVKTVLDHIMLLTGSIYYVNYDQEFIVEPIEPTSPTSVCTFRGEDIFKVNTEGFDWQSHYTGIKWNDNENAIQSVEMTYTDRELYQYDYNELSLSLQYITDSTERTAILDNLLALYKYLKREVKIECKWNPEVLVNTYITLDVPEEPVIDDRFMVWNKDQWNAGKYWGIASPGISFDSDNLWRVVEIKRDVEGMSMQLVLVQLYSDDESQ